jgi:hypothetical protein
MATPDRPDQAPMARARSAGANVASRIARLPGVSSAAPTPWSTLVMMRATTLGANPHAAEARANHTMPIRYTFRRPNRSPSEPPISKNAASVRM